MSAVPLDEFSFDGLGDEVRLTRAPHRPANLAAAASTNRRPAPADRGVGIARPTGSSWRLTDRGIVVALVVFVGLFLAGAVVAVASFFAISDAPMSAQSVGAAPVVTVVGG